MSEEDKNRIHYLESVIDDIAGALCDYCNQVGDPFDPPSKWDEYCERSFVNLCKVYNDWHSKHKEIETITMREYLKEKEIRLQAGARIAHHLQYIRGLDEDAKKKVQDMIERGHW